MNHLATPRQLRQQAQLFREAANKLEEAAALIDGGQEDPVGPLPKPEVFVPVPPMYGRSERRQQLVKLFQEHGPLRRNRIIELLPDMPKGTLAYLLRDKRYFIGRHQKWNVVT